MSINRVVKIKKSYFSDLDSYPFDIANQYIKGTITGAGFKSFFDDRIKGEYPVSVIDKSYKKLINSKSQTILLTSENLKSNIKKIWI